LIVAAVAVAVAVAAAAVAAAAVRTAQQFLLKTENVLAHCFCQSKTAHLNLLQISDFGAVRSGGGVWCLVAAIVHAVFSEMETPALLG